MPDPPESVKAALADRYVLEREVGAGGMATVYLARDLKHDRPVALKVLRPELATTLGPERFLAEIRTTARLQHPHIVPLFDSGEAEGFLYYVMPFIEGESLRCRLEGGRQLGIDAVLAIAHPVARALAHAHDRGVVHRDIKPENILLAEDQAFVTDFGIARAVSVAGGERLTATGVAVGTPAYMSPEQVLGDEGVDERSDVYSLGCVIYEMLSGAPPFGGPTAQSALTRRLTGPPPSLADIPPALNDVVRRSLEPAPVDRFATVLALADALFEAARKPAVPEKSIVVLPFDNLSPDPDNAFFADGLTEELIADLSKVRALRVISRTSAMQFRGTTKGIPAIAGELNVGYVLEGSVRRAGNSLRITAQLIDAATDTHLWAEKYGGSLEDVFDLQERLSRQIVEALELTLSPEEDRKLSARPIQDVRAHDAWLRALQEVMTFTPAGFDRAFNLVNHALSVLGDNALLHAGLGYFYAIAYDFGIRHDVETLAHGERHARLALDLDPSLGRALFAMAYVRYKQGDLPAAIRLARRGADQDGNLDSLWMLGFGLAEAGRVEEARRFAEDAMAIDPLNLMSGFARGAVEFFGGRFGAAAEWFLKYLRDIAPDSPILLWWAAQARAHEGKGDEARRLFERVAELDAVPISDLSALHCLAMAGNGDQVREALEGNAQLREAALTDEWFPIAIAVSLSVTDEYEGAIDWLERAVGWGFTNWRFLCEYSPFFAPLRGHPRFQSLLVRAKKLERGFDL